MITIDDSAAALAPAQRAALTSKAAAYPFDVHVLIGTGSGWISESRENFEHEVIAHVPPNSRVVSVGVDPYRHFTFVRSSAALGVPAGPAVAAAGNPYFKQGNLVDGIDAILGRAQTLRVEPRPTPIAAVEARPAPAVATPIVVHDQKMSAGFWWGLGGVTLVTVGVLVWLWVRARRRDAKLLAAQADLQLETAALRGRRMVTEDWDERLEASRRNAPRKYSSPPSSPRVSAPPPVTDVYGRTGPVISQPAPVIINQPNSSLDLLLAAELMRDNSSPVIEREVIREVGVPTPAPDPAPSSSFWESSSDTTSTTSFESSSDSSSSSFVDSDTSSSSSFDSGGGFDGGGSDSSSGSDW